MLEIAYEYVKNNIQRLDVPQFQIYCEKFTNVVFSRNFLKRYMIVIDKRRVLGNNTRPYGYVD